MEDSSLDRMTNEGGVAQGVFFAGREEGRSDAHSDIKPKHRLTNDRIPLSPYTKGYIVGYALGYREKNSEAMKGEKVQKLLDHAWTVISDWYGDGLTIPPSYLADQLMGLRATIIHVGLNTPAKPSEEEKIKLDSFAEKVILAAFNIGRYCGENMNPLEPAEKDKIVDAAVKTLTVQNERFLSFRKVIRQTIEEAVRRNWTPEPANYRYEDHNRGTAHCNCEKCKKLRASLA